jgi:hypothetical protein
LPLPHSAATVAPYKYEIRLNPTLGGTPVTWNNVSADSNFDYAVAPDGTVEITGGTLLASGYSTVNQQISLTGLNFDKFLRLGCAVNGTRDTLWIVVTPLTNSTIDGFHGALSFVESD